MWSVYMLHCRFNLQFEFCFLFVYGLESETASNRISSSILFFLMPRTCLGQSAACHLSADICIKEKH
jgi:hypothetical protein